MSSAVGVSVAVVACLTLFTVVGLLFLFANLVVGWLVRPKDPHAEKLEIYECGEPTIGSSFVQFDLRFYVVALLFIIFDVEVAFFFPWAVIFGKATNLADPHEANAVVVREGDGLALTPSAEAIYREMGVRNPRVPDPQAVPTSLKSRVKGSSDLVKSRQIVKAGAGQLAVLTIVDIGVFFLVLLVGFAYVWRRGDLDWVRAVSMERASASNQTVPISASNPNERVLSL